MKKWAIIITVLFNAFMWAQTTVSDADLPEAVSKSFKRAYPAAFNVNWEREGQDYEATYVDNGKTMIVYYDSTGKVKRYDKEIDAGELPQIHVQRIRELYANDFRIQKVILRDYTSTNPTYFVTVQRGSFYYKFTFEPQDMNDHTVYIQRTNPN
ncbi:MAG TPA: hypothetical protein VL947_12485 [Cytophagales bacterium]|nr:hypothetical protein [Cytophagales bacterium]